MFCRAFSLQGDVVFWPQPARAKLSQRREPVPTLAISGLWNFILGRRKIFQTGRLLLLVEVQLLGREHAPEDGGRRDRSHSSNLEGLAVARGHVTEPRERKHLFRSGWTCDGWVASHDGIAHYPL